MSIALKKFLSMLENGIASDDSINKNQKTILKKLCERIYMIEMTSDASQITSNIKEEIKLYAKSYEE